MKKEEEEEKNINLISTVRTENLERNVILNVHISSPKIVQAT